MPDSVRRSSANLPKVREHLGTPLHRTCHYLILGTSITSLLDVGFWALAAHS